MELNLRGNNLYRNGYIMEFPETGESLLLRDPIEYLAEDADTYHIVKDNDRLDLLAYKYYSHLIEDSSKYWWVIADVNNIQMPLDLLPFVGKQLLIPDLFKVLLELQ